VLALELERTASDAPVVVDGPQRKSQLYNEIYADFGFIISYTLLWVVMGLRIGRIVAILAVLGGLADVIEDIGILAVLGATQTATQPTQTMVNLVYSASSIKWMLLGRNYSAGYIWCKRSS